MSIAGPPSAVSRARASRAARQAAWSAGLSTRSSGGYPQMNSSVRTMRSAPAAAALARAPRAFSALPATSPTTGLSWAMVMASRSGTLMAIHLAPAGQGGNPGRLSPHAGRMRGEARRRRASPATARRQQAAAETFFLEEFGKQKRQLDRLLGVQSRIAERMVAIVEILFADGACSTGAFRH